MKIAKYYPDPKAQTQEGEELQIDFTKARFHPLPDQMIETVHDHVARCSIRNAYRYIEFLHQKYGEPVTKPERSRRIREGMEKAKRMGKRIGRPLKAVFRDYECA